MQLTFRAVYDLGSFTRTELGESEAKGLDEFLKVNAANC